MKLQAPPTASVVGSALAALEQLSSVSVNCAVPAPVIDAESSAIGAKPMSETASAWLPP